MRYVLLAALVVVACRGERAAGTRPEAERRSEPAVAAPHAEDAADSRSEHPSGISDDQLVAFVRWQREYMEALGRQSATINAITSDASKRYDDASVQEAVRAATEATARFAPVVEGLHRRQPLQGTKAELATEAIGGLYHWDLTATGVQFVFARDEERIGAARRRFGEKAVDDILARESLILTEIQR